LHLYERPTKVILDDLGGGGGCEGVHRGVIDSEYKILKDLIILELSTVSPIALAESR
jgi:hypothetical protein